MILWTVLAIYCFWLGFLMYAAVMNVGWKNLKLFLKIMLLPPGILFLLFDVVFNALAGSIIFLQRPWMNKCYTLSERMSWLIANDKGWRGKVATFIVGNFLLPFTKSY